MKKNPKKIIIVNLVLLLLFAIFIETICFLNLPADQKEYLNNLNKAFKQQGIPITKVTYNPTIEFDLANARIKMRKPLKGKNPGILFIGCSYTYGTLLKKTQTLPYKIHKLTGRTVYNRGIEGAGPQVALYDISQDDFKTQVPNAKYIIYTFIWDHMLRLYAYTLSPFPNSNGNIEANVRYEIKNGELKLITPKLLPLYSLFSVKRAQLLIENKNTEKLGNNYNLLIAVLKEIKKKTDEYYPNSKFIVLLYKDSGHSTMADDQRELLADNGFVVIDAEELVGHELESAQYRAEDKEHPSEKAWNEVAPKLAKYLKF